MAIDKTGSGYRHVVEARALVLRAKSGAVQAIVGDLNDGAFGLRIFNDKVKARIEIVVRSDGSTGVVLRDVVEGLRLSIDLLKDGSPDITLRDARNQPRVGLGLSEVESKATMILKDRHSAPTCIFEVPHFGAPVMVLCEGRRRRHASMYINNSGMGVSILGQR